MGAPPFIGYRIRNRFRTGASVTLIAMSLIGASASVNAASVEEILKRVERLENENRTLRHRLDRYEANRSTHITKRVAHSVSNNDASVKSTTEIFANRRATQPESWTGLYVGAFYGRQWGHVNGTEPLPPTGQTSTDQPIYGNNFGAKIGMNLRFQSLLFGSEIEGAVLDTKGFQSVVGNAGLTGSCAQTASSYTPLAGSAPKQLACEARNNWMATASLRFGRLLFDDTVLLYLKGGVAFTSLATAYAFNVFLPSGVAIDIQSGSKILTGASIGGGMEAKISERISTGVEYTFYNFGSQPFTSGYAYYIPQQGFQDPSAGWQPAAGSSHGFNSQIVKLFMNYKIGD